jgi:hypothetical protein
VGRLFGAAFATETAFLRDHGLEPGEVAALSGLRRLIVFMTRNRSVWLFCTLFMHFKELFELFSVAQHMDSEEGLGCFFKISLLLH